MDQFECPECLEVGRTTMVEVTEEETYEGCTTFSGFCPIHEETSHILNWRNP